jgi:hypothetical protein
VPATSKGRKVLRQKKIFIYSEVSNVWVVVQ